MDWDPNELTASQRQEMVESAQRHMFYGFLWMAGGIGITYYSMTNGNGGVITYGAIIYGVYDFFKGLNGWITYR